MQIFDLWCKKYSNLLLIPFFFLFFSFISFFLSACTTEAIENSVNNYIGPCCWIFGFPQEQSTWSTSWSHEAQDSFWKTSVDITKQDFDFSIVE